MTVRHIRHVTEQDFKGWLPLWEGYNAFYGRSGSTALPAAVTRTTWARFLDPAEPVHAIVAESDGRLIGLAHYLFHRSTTSIGMSCYLQDLFTSEVVRGSGVGGALVNRVYQEAKSAGSSRVYWQTHETNDLAMRLYNKLALKSGFVVYSRTL
jgi:GNAT superfamily N-acetyltransferase